MDSKIMGMIDKDVSSCYVPKKKKDRYRQYDAAKQRLAQKYPGRVEYEYLCKAVAKRYKL